jgi:hypothetical protein
MQVAIEPGPLGGEGLAAYREWPENRAADRREIGLPRS